MNRWIFCCSSDDDDDDDDENNTAEPAEKTKKNPLVVEMEDQDIMAQRKSEMWFSKVNDLLTENLDEDEEMETPAKQASSKKRQREMEESSERSVYGAAWLLR